MNTDPGLTLSPIARTYLTEVLQAKPAVVGIRLGVKKAGCSGYEYTLEFADTVRAEEKPFFLDGITLLVDETLYWKFFKGGTVLDYEQKGLQGHIFFHNPNVEAQCGCGESFTLKEEGA
jgi:iron-sulfur cluster assembly accessory protein